MTAKQSGHANGAQRPTDFADNVGRTILATKSADHQKRLGIYLTPVAVADFIASMIDLTPEPLRIMDPAAGSGTLLCAAIEKLAARHQSAERSELEIVAYEIDKDLARGLESVLECAAKFASSENIRLRFRVVERDFLLEHAGLLSTSGQLFVPIRPNPFDLIVTNPPYFKLAKA